MVKEVKKFVEEVNELKALCLKQFCESDMLDIFNMDEKQFVLFKKMFELMDTSLMITVSQAELMDEMNSKLDKLLVMKIES